MCEMETLIEVNGELVIKEEVLKELEELKEQQKSVKAKLDTLSGKITNELKQHYNTTTKVGEYNFTIKGGYYSFEFDMEAFKNEQVAMYIKYLKPKQTTITYQLARATREKRNV